MLETVLAHEMVHIMSPKVDEGIGVNQGRGEPTGLKDEIVIYTNDIFKRLGYHLIINGPDRLIKSRAITGIMEAIS
jgi:hypothetical protein